MTGNLCPLLSIKRIGVACFIHVYRTDPNKELGTIISNIRALDKEMALLEAARLHDEKAFNEIIGHYEPEVLKIARKYFIPRGEYEDVIQEGRIAIYSAVLSYNAEIGIPFLHFLRMVVKRKLIESIRKYTSKKHNVLNLSYSIDSVFSDSNKSRFTDLQSSIEDPESTIIANEVAQSMIHALQNNLSNQEILVFKYYFIQGFKPREVSELLETNTKSIDNTIQRVRRKLFIHQGWLKHDLGLGKWERS